MDVHAIHEVELNAIAWDQYDVIILASGFEARSAYIFRQIPEKLRPSCVILGFYENAGLLSRPENDQVFCNSGAKIFVADTHLKYDDHIKQILLGASRAVVGRPMKIFVDYSVMTRLWYAFILTWIKYSGDAAIVEVDFAYSYGKYDGAFDDLQITEWNTIPNFEGISTGSRRTIALYGLGYDKFATLAVHETIQPDIFVCFIARDDPGDESAKYAAKENAEIINQSGRAPVVLPLGNLASVVQEMSTLIESFGEVDEIIAVPMGPKTHVLATLLAAHKISRLTCWHPLGHRDRPIQVHAEGRVSCWRVIYKD